MTTCYISAEAVVNFVVITAGIIGIVCGAMTFRSIEDDKNVKKP